MIKVSHTLKGPGHHGTSKMLALWLTDFTVWLLMVAWRRLAILGTARIIRNISLKTSQILDLTFWVTLTVPSAGEASWELRLQSKIAIQLSWSGAQPGRQQSGQAAARLRTLWKDRLDWVWCQAGQARPAAHNNSQTVRSSSLNVISQHQGGREAGRREGSCTEFVNIRHLPI